MVSIETEPTPYTRFAQLSAELTNWFRYRLLINVDWVPTRTADKVIAEEQARLKLFAANKGLLTDGITEDDAFKSLLDRNKPPEDERKRIESVWNQIQEALQVLAKSGQQ